jgi:hypothetical protein
MNERKETCSLFARVEIMWALLLGVRGTEESGSLCSHKAPKQVQMIKADKDYELLCFVGKTMYLHLFKLLVGIQSTIQS